MYRLVFFLLLFLFSACITEHELEHCFNNSKDELKGETGLNCGGPCPPCEVETNNCNNNLMQDNGEFGMDCGGPCPPCVDNIRYTKGELKGNTGNAETHLFRIDDNTIVIFSVSNPIQYYDIALDSIYYIESNDDTMARDAAYTQLSNNNIFICGGKSKNTGIPNTYLFDAVNRDLKPLDDLQTPRYGHTANVLYDTGIVMVLGGAIDPFNPLKSAEFYDVSNNKGTNFFNKEDLLFYPRQNHTCSAISTQKYIVCGGTNNDTIIEEIEFFTGVFPTPSDTSTNINTDHYSASIVKRFNHQANFINSNEWGGQGKLVISGGKTSLISNAAVNSVEIFDSSFNPTIDDMDEEIGHDHSSLYIPKVKKILVSGGTYNSDNNPQTHLGYINDDVTYIPVEVDFEDLDLLEPRRKHDMIIITEDDNQTEVLVVGGNSQTKRGEIITINYP